MFQTYTLRVLRRILKCQKISYLKKIVELYDQAVSVFTQNGNVYTGKIKGLADKYLLLGDGVNFIKNVRIDYQNISFLDEAILQKHDVTVPKIA